MSGASGVLSLLLPAAPALPCLLALLCVAPKVRRWAPAMMALAPVPALLAALLVPQGISPLSAPAPLRITLTLDAPGALLLGTSAVLWMAAGAYAAVYLRDDPARPRFAIWWLLTMGGSFGVFIVADLSSFYLAFALASLSAYGLVAHDDTPEARRAGALYLGLTLFGEALLIAGFVMLAAGSPDGNPLIADAVAGLAVSPWRDAIVALLVAGFGLKMGFVPLHVWMPIAHGVAPVPGSAVLSGIVVKAGVIGLIRFLPMDGMLSAWGAAITTMGIVTAYYGIAIGLTQSHPKRVLAYSTVSQMGVVGAVIGAGLWSGDAAAPVIAAFYAANHILLKGAMFLAVGIAAASGARCLWLVLAVSAVLGLSLAGLPLTGGALAKIAIKGPLGEGMAGSLLALSAAGTTMLMARFVIRLQASADGSSHRFPPLALGAPWLALCGGALVVPFVLFQPVTGASLASAFSAGSLWKGLWPVALGLVATTALAWRGPRLREIPAGDVLLLAERLAPAVSALSEGVGRLDEGLRRWPVAGLLVLALIVAFATALEATR
ncbi:complex I subunit 5 family protein [Azorhizobium sp. AG788]|uniref:complex I subunit 5 family protein n=1 Tax=Azorhizobium sp. AG788 TaxID=2183897 RepID=UPI003139E5A3